MARLVAVGAIASALQADASRLRNVRPAFIHSGSLTRTVSRWTSSFNNDSVVEGAGDVVGDVAEVFEGEKKPVLVCGRNPVVDSESERASCPAECPLLAEKRGNEQHCDFHCVDSSKEACIAMDPKTTVPDLELGYCRPCAVQGCSECARDGTDNCAKCYTGYFLQDGQCVNTFRHGWYIFGFVLVVIVALVILWVVDLSLRPITNRRVLQNALELRSRAKLRQPKAEENADMDTRQSSRALWPYSTNLCRNGQVAGPGLTLAFNFQVAIVIWAVVMAVSWLCLGYYANALEPVPFGEEPDLFRMGTRKWDSARQQCMVIAWGYETQHRLMWTKVAYLTFAYVFTFMGSLLFSVRQLRMFQSMDIHMTTHKDFCAIASGLAGISGERRLEEELKEFFEKETGKEVMTVSVSYVYIGREDEFMDIVDNDMIIMHHMWKHRNPTGEPESEESEEDEVEDDEDEEMTQSERQKMKEQEHADLTLEATRSSKQLETTTEQTIRTRIMRSVESVFLSTPMQKALTRGRAKGFQKRHQTRRETDNSNTRQVQSSAQKGKGAMKDMRMQDHNDETIQKLSELKTSGKVFVVFNTEQERDDIVEAWQSRTTDENKKGVKFEGMTVTLTVADSEPESVRWENFADEAEPFNLSKKILWGVGCIVVALAVWTGVFYLPFVWVSASASYTYGAAPSGASTFVFGMVVVAGNALMYTTCSEITDRMRFPYRSDAEICYMMFYTVACTFNVVLDIVVTAMVSYWTLSGLGARMYNGKPIEDAGSVVQILCTYGMQRELGHSTKAYAWPSTFLIPFLLEGLTIYIPYQIMVLLVRTHSDIHTSSAEAYLASIPFDLSRYADIHLNIILAVLILFFPGGYNLEIYFGLAVAGLWIYFYDHVRVLRFCPSFNYASMDVDWWAQWMMAFPCAILLSALFWKLNQDQDFELSRAMFGDTLGDPDHSSLGITVIAAALFGLHILVHSLLLWKIVPLFGINMKDNRPGQTVPQTYKECAERLPCSWITANPINCLRSDYIYQHEPPMVHCVPGKEHLMMKNTQVGQYFSDIKSPTEDYDEWTPSRVWDNMKTSIKSAVGNEDKPTLEKVTEEPSDEPKGAKK